MYNNNLRTPNGRKRTILAQLQGAIQTLNTININKGDGYIQIAITQIDLIIAQASELKALKKELIKHLNNEEQGNGI